MTNALIEKLRQKVNLGNNVYIYHDGYNIVLESPKDQFIDIIKLDPDMLTRLETYKNHIDGIIKQIKKGTIL